MLSSIRLDALLAERVQAQLDQLGCLVRCARFGRWPARGRQARVSLAGLTRGQVVASAGVLATVRLTAAPAIELAALRD
jgi:hypothetical protein